MFSAISDKNSCFNNEKYSKTASKIIKESLDSGMDVVQHYNGDIIITGNIIKYFYYTWDPRNSVLIKKSVTAPDLINKQRRLSKYNLNIEDLWQDKNYLNAISEITREATLKGWHILHNEDGEIVVSAKLLFITKYNWDEKKNIMIKVTSTMEG